MATSQQPPLNRCSVKAALFRIPWRHVQLLSVSVVLSDAAIVVATVRLLRALRSVIARGRALRNTGRRRNQSAASEVWHRLIIAFEDESYRLTSDQPKESSFFAAEPIEDDGDAGEPGAGAEPHTAPLPRLLERNAAPVADVSYLPGSGKF